MAIFTIERPGQLVYFPDSNARVFARSPSGIFYTAYLRWVAGLISVVISRSTDGQVWTIDSELTDPGGSYDYPSLAVDSNNGLHLTAHHIGTGTVYTSKPSGGVWGAEQLIFASWGAAALAIDRNNNIHFV